MWPLSHCHGHQVSSCPSVTMLQAQSPTLMAPTSPFVMLPPPSCSSCWWELTHGSPPLPGLASSDRSTGPWLLVGTGRAYCILISTALFGKPPGTDLAPLFSRGAEETHPTHNPAQEHPLRSPPVAGPSGSLSHHGCLRDGGRVHRRNQGLQGTAQDAEAPAAKGEHPGKGWVVLASHHGSFWILKQGIR